MKIARPLYDELIRHAQEDAPDECCGMVGFKDGRAIQIYRAENTDHSPLRYEVDPKDQLRIELAIDDADQTLGAIYHSHTRSEPYPSQTDINLAFHPDTLYIIVGLASSEPKICAYRIIDGQVTQVQVEVD